LPVEKSDQSHVTRFIVFGVWGDGGSYAVFVPILDGFELFFFVRLSEI
jgi:hypothetical protein